MAPTHTPSAHARRGLTFIELMFATIILGVGMIIIAAAFPVAINEQRITVDEATVASLERGAIRTLDAAVHQVKPTSEATDPTRWLPDTTFNSVAVDTDNNASTPPDNVKHCDVQSFGANNALWSQIAGSLVSTENERYAWVPLFMRPFDATLPLDKQRSDVTFFVVSMVSRDKATFDASDPVELNKLKPVLMKLTYRFKSDSANDFELDPEQDTIKLTLPSGASDARLIRSAVEGGFIVRGANVVPSSPLFPQNAIIKLGTQFADDEMKPGSVDAKTRYFRVAPGFELLKDDVLLKEQSSSSYKLPAAVTDVNAWVVGRYVDLGTGPDAEPADESLAKSGKANRALSCRGIKVDVPPPG